MYIRLILFAILAYLIIRLIRRFFDGGNDSDDNNVSTPGGGKKVSGETGEYVDYEEIKD